MRTLRALVGPNRMLYITIYGSFQDIIVRTEGED
jgi:hypothetical protein